VKTPSPDTDWQRIWFSSRKQNWSSLSLIPSDPGIDVTKVAEALTATGRLHGERPVNLVNAVGVQLGDVHHVIDSLTSLVNRGSWVVVPVDPIAENPSAAAIVRATSAALLVVRLGQSFLPSARGTLDVIGREHFLGSVVLDDAGQVSDGSFDAK